MGDAYRKRGESLVSWSKMKAEGKECCCKDMAGKEHAGHDTHEPDAAKTPQADQHKH